MRMRLGDMEIDSEQGIRVGSTPLGEEPIADDEIADRARSSLREKLRPSTWQLLALAGFLLSTGLAAVAFFWTPLAVAALPGTITLVVLGVAYGKERPSESSGAVALDDERARRLEALLSDRTATIDQLVEETGWREEFVLSGLRSLHDRGILDEDLDLQTGIWVYSLEDSSLEPEPARLPLDERLERIQEESIETTAQEVVTADKGKP